MKKLSLDLEALEVETFEVAEERHTPFGMERELTGPDNCVTITCGDSVVRPCE